MSLYDIIDCRLGPDHWSTGRCYFFFEYQRQQSLPALASRNRHNAEPEYYQPVPAAMIDSFENSSGTFGKRLLDALKAGVDAGGEAGPLHSAGLLIGGDVSWPRVELRIDWDDDPIAKMYARWAVYEPQIEDYITRAIDPRKAPSYGVPGDL